MTRVFISYSRKDKLFAERLSSALRDIGLDSWVDWIDIPVTSNWREQIQEGIESADGFVFLLSPDSIASQVCKDEIDHAVQNGKRLIPVVVRDVKPENVPEAVNKLNWIFFREVDDFHASLKKLEYGIKTDLAWVEFHRRLQVRAIEWERRSDRSLLLRGRDLREAEEHLANAARKDPQPTDLQRQFVLESRRRESQVRNLFLSIGGVVLVILALLSFFALDQRNLANTNALTAIANQHAAETAQVDALDQKETAVANENEAVRQSKLALARQLAAQAQNFDLENGTTAIQSGLLAVEAGSRGAGWTADQALRRYLALAGTPITTMVHETEVRSVAFSSSGKYILSANFDGTARFWEAATGKEISRITLNTSSTIFRLINDDKYVVSISTSSGTYLVYERVCAFEVFTGNEVACVDLGNETHFASVSMDGRYMISGTRQGIAQTWDLMSGKEVARVIFNGEVFGGSISSDSRWISFYACDKYDSSEHCIQSTIHIQDRTAANEVARKTYSGAISNVEISPNGSWVVFDTCEHEDPIQGTCPQHIIRVWEIPTGNEIATITPLNQLSGSLRISISPNSRYIAVNTDLGIETWDLATRTALGQVSAEGGQTILGTFSPDGFYFSWFNLIGGVFETLNISSVITGRNLASLSHGGPINSAAFSPDGKFVVTGSQDGTTRVWQSDSGKEIARLNHDGPVYAVAFSPLGGGKYIASAGSDGLVHLWDISAGDKVIYANDINDDAFISLSQDSKYMVVASEKEIRIWEVISGKQMANITSPYSVESAVLSRDGRYVIGGLYNAKVYVWDAATGHVIAGMTEDASPGIVVPFDVSADGRLVVSGGEEIKVWELTTGRVITRFPHWGSLLMFSPDSSVVVSNVDDNTLHVWQANGGSVIARITQSDPITSIDFSPDGRYLLTGSSNKTAHVWEAKTGKEVAAVSHDAGVTSVAFSPDGKYAVTGSNDQTARIWESATGIEIIRMAHDASVNSVAFSPDGNYVVTGSADQTVRVWDLHTEKEIVRIANPDLVIAERKNSAVTFSPDGQFLVPEIGDESAYLWYWRMEDLITETCKRLPRNLHLTEWEFFIPNEEYHATCGPQESHVGYMEGLLTEEIINKINADRLSEALDLLNQAESQGLSINTFIVEDSLLEKFKSFISTNKWEEASDWLQESESNHFTFLRDAYYLNELCWSEVLDGNAIHVLKYCERALELLPTDPIIHDSRGLARALNGDTVGAKEDFQFFVDFFIDDSFLGPEKYNELLEQRRQWILDLSAGNNPFTPELLEMLKQQ